MRHNTRLTEGDLFTNLLRFSLPFLAANFLQALYGAADLLIVGRFASPAAVSAVATGGQVMQTVTGAAVGLTTGGTVLVGRLYGAKRRRELGDAVGTVLCVFGMLSVALTLALGFSLSPVCRMMHVPPAALADTWRYLFLCACGVVFIVGYNAVSGVLRGLGDSLTPLKFVAAACICNIAGDCLLVGRYQLGAAGAAIATVAAQGISVILAFLYLLRRGTVRRFVRRRVQVRACTAADILRIGFPIALQESLINVSFLLITAIVNTLGVAASAAVGIVEKLIVLSMLPTTAFSSAVAVLTAQHWGAGLHIRAKRGLKMGIGLSLALGGVFFLAAQLAGPALVGLFCTDPAVIAAGAAYLHTYSLDCVLVCFVFCYNSYFTGRGRALFPLLHSLVATFLVRVPLSYALSRLPNASMAAIGCAAPAATLLSFALCRWYFRRLEKK